MFLAHLLQRSGIDTVILERRSQEHVQHRVRAGVLEQVTVQLMESLGLADRMHREGLVHRGTNICVDGDVFHINMAALTQGATVMVYGQSELMKDLNESAAALGIHVIYEVGAVALHDLASDAPSVSWSKDGAVHALQCDFIAGCDGYRGVSRAHIPKEVLSTFERTYPFGWLGILAEVPPCEQELIYANHEHGFALASMRSARRSRYYIQTTLEDEIEDWPDERFWDELCLRLGPQAARGVTRGPSVEKTIAPLRSFVCEPMRWKRLFLAGDAAHIVPPTGAKGLNLAASDVLFLAQALTQYYATGSAQGIDGYSTRALARVWKAERFSWWFTSITHRYPNMDSFDRKMQVAELAYIRGSKAAQTTLAENYVGLPMASDVPMRSFK
jgi:p-hydroxybenzoate 3-monooxygenase